MTSSQRKSTVRRFKTFGLSDPDINKIMLEVTRLLNTNGPEWTISRLKTMKTAFIHKIAHVDPEWTWIKTRSGLPVGPFRAIFNLKKPHKVLNALMVYSQLVSPALTSKQWKKFHSSVVKVRSNPINIFDNLDVLISKPIHTLNISDERTSRMLLSRVRSPSIVDGKMKTARLDSKQRIRSANHLLARSYINKNMANGILPEWFVQEVRNNWRYVQSVHDGLDSKGVVGRISFLQEPGYKLRAIANPLPIFQILLDPLKRSLLDLLRLIPNDFTHDQDSGVTFVQQLLKDGMKLSSVDLSDATNHLPLTDQLNVLYHLYGSTAPEVHLFKDVSTSGWAVDGPNGEEILHWGTGQPLGLGPSFPSFALYHHFIMRHVISLVDDDPDILTSFIDGFRLGGGEISRLPYAIVGDDIVMDSKYTDVYISTIQNLGCEISFDKCLFKANTAEFCSRVIMRDKVVRAYKWKSITDSSFIAMCKSFGPNILPLLRPRQKAIAKYIGEIPDTLGGPIGWNPDGKCLMQREAELWRLAESLEDLKTDLDISVPKAEIHFRLKQELGLIRFPFYSVNDVFNNSVKTTSDSVSPRLRFAQELYSHIKTGMTNGEAFKLASVFIHTSESKQAMSELERKLRGFVFPVVTEKDLVDGDLYIKKLYALLFRKD
jgi:hypothetical protein